ncbi:uncharacterized protein G2W53_037415 [Senna tora]|nr:uncharacterized protein G2W53_037415 [Senna tora]
MVLGWKRDWNMGERLGSVFGEGMKGWRLEWEKGGGLVRFWNWGRSLGWVTGLGWWGMKRGAHGWD